MEQGRSSEARVPTHTLKGEAGSVAAREVARSAYSLEKAILSASDWSQPLLELERHLEMVLDGSGRLTKITPEPVEAHNRSADDPGVPIVRVDSLMQRLSRLLNQNNMAAYECFHELNSQLEGIPGIRGDLQSLAKSLETPEFDRARDALDTLAGLLDIDLNP